MKYKPIMICWYMNFLLRKTMHQNVTSPPVRKENSLLVTDFYWILPALSKNNYLYLTSYIKINSHLGSIAKHASVMTRRRRINSSVSKTEQEVQKLAMAKKQNPELKFVFNMVMVCLYCESQFQHKLKVITASLCCVRHI